MTVFVYAHIYQQDEYTVLPVSRDGSREGFSINFIRVKAKIVENFETKLSHHELSLCRHMEMQKRPVESKVRNMARMNFTQNSQLEINLYLNSFILYSIRAFNESQTSSYLFNYA